MTKDKKFMMLALEEARKGVGFTSPNPAVGAVIVREGQLLAAGHHRTAGGPHAEIEAIHALGNPRAAVDAVLYVTLEPCSTQGRTPPCTTAILEAGFARVVIGTTDPNPAHAGRAIPLLEAAGIQVTVGVLESKCRTLNLSFNKWITQGLPWVIAKAGMTLDGRITRAPDRGRWITNARSRAHAHQVRARVDAILVGSQTVRTDRPVLTVRGVTGARQPWRVVLNRSGNLPLDSPLFTDEFKERTLLESGETLLDVLHALGERGIQSVLIEGGANVLGQAFDEELVDEVYFYVAPLLTGGPLPSVAGKGAALPKDAMQFEQMEYAVLNGDVMIHGFRRARVRP